jgi:hypothetical protein
MALDMPKSSLSPVSHKMEILLSAQSTPLGYCGHESAIGVQSYRAP